MRGESDAWVVQPEAEFAAARAVLATDRVANVYALGDLEPPYDRYTSVALALRRGVPEAACLTVRHPAFTGIVTHGNVDGLELLLQAIDLPRTTHLDIPTAHRPILDRFYALSDPHKRQLMAVTPQGFRPAPSIGPAPARLVQTDLDDLIDLYGGYEASAFHPAQLAHGVFYGVREGERLVAAGGTPGLALQSGVAVVTSVFTRPEARRRGYGAAVTGAITAALFALGCDMVCLDVDTENTIAFRLYQRLGYRLHSLRWQGEATRLRHG